VKPQLSTTTNKECCEYATCLHIQIKSAVNTTAIYNYCKSTVLWIYTAIYIYSAVNTTAVHNSKSTVLWICDLSTHTYHTTRQNTAYTWNVDTTSLIFSGDELNMGSLMARLRVLFTNFMKWRTTFSSFLMALGLRFTWKTHTAAFQGCENKKIHLHRRRQLKSKQRHHQITKHTISFWEFTILSHIYF